MIKTFSIFNYKKFMNKVECKIEILSYAKSQVGNYVLVLSELDTSRKLPIIIKAADAQFIAVRMENINTSRPMTQDLFKLMSDAYNIDIHGVVIYEVLEGIFYARLETTNGLETFSLDCTVGDALSMSVLYNCPIYVSEKVMQLSGINMNITQTTSEPSATKTRRKLPKSKPKAESLESLSKMLENALEVEDYILAAELRDKINSMKNT
jgi:bifunctional DNase/RNase